jgi:AraC-like DNA-binding protein
MNAADIFSAYEGAAKDIALSIGYENASKFSATFKSAKGENPPEFRRRYRASI